MSASMMTEYGHHADGHRSPAQLQAQRAVLPATDDRAAHRPDQEHHHENRRKKGNALESRQREAGRQRKEQSPDHRQGDTPGGGRRLRLRAAGVSPLPARRHSELVPLSIELAPRQATVLQLLGDDIQVWPPRSDDDTQGCPRVAEGTQAERPSGRVGILFPHLVPRPVVTVEFVLDEHRVHHPHARLVPPREVLDLRHGGLHRAQPRSVQPYLHEQPTSARTDYVRIRSLPLPHGPPPCLQQLGGESGLLGCFHDGEENLYPPVERLGRYRWHASVPQFRMLG
jgi:hypothetical protein